MHRLSAYVIVHRTETDWTANGIRSDSGRNPIGRRTESDWTANANGRGCSCLSCTNKANRVNRTTKVNDTNVGGYGILAVVTLPSAVIFSHR